MTVRVLVMTRSAIEVLASKDDLIVATSTVEASSMVLLQVFTPEVYISLFIFIRSLEGPITLAAIYMQLCSEKKTDCSSNEHKWCNLVMAGWVFSSVKFKLGNVWARIAESDRTWRLHQSTTPFPLIILSNIREYNICKFVFALFMVHSLYAKRRRSDKRGEQVFCR
jgi:hypothetical protein